MIFKNEIWSIVTARKNSKSIKFKNLVPVNNKPLIQYSFDVLKNNKLISKNVISTDHAKIISISKKYNFEIIKRPKNLSGDLINSVDVVLHVLKKMNSKFKYLPKWFVLIQPTSIFLQSSDLNKLIKKFNNSSANSAQTIVKVPHQFHAYNQRYFDGKYTEFIFANKRKKQHNKQVKDLHYAYGNLIATKTESFIDKKNFFCKPSIGVEISKIRSFDLDNLEDLKLISQIIKKKISFYEI